MSAESPADPEGDDLVPLSALNALLYCDRRAALRHLDGLYVHNEHTLRGDRLHARADRPGVERRRGVRTERGLWDAVPAAQREWVDRLRQRGYAAVVCFGREEAIAVFEAYRKGRLALPAGHWYETHEAALAAGGKEAPNGSTV